jgi:hypothetical protein
MHRKSLYGDVQLVATGDIVRSFAHPHSQARGLHHNGKHLLAPGGPVGVYVIDPKTGAVVKLISTGGTQDVVSFGDSLWTTRWGNSLIRQWDWDGNLLKTVTAFASGQGGITTDGRYLYFCSITGNDWLVQLDFEGNAVSVWQNVIGNPSALSYAGSGRFYIVSDSNNIYLVDFAGRNQIKVITQPATDAKGVAFDGRYLWVADDIAQTIYQVEV